MKQYYTKLQTHIETIYNLQFIYSLNAHGIEGVS